MIADFGQALVRCSHAVAEDGPHAEDWPRILDLASGGTRPLPEAAGTHYPLPAPQTPGGSWEIYQAGRHWLAFLVRFEYPARPPRHSLWLRNWRDGSFREAALSASYRDASAGVARHLARRDLDSPQLVKRLRYPLATVGGVRLEVGVPRARIADAPLWLVRGRRRTRIGTCAAGSYAYPHVGCYRARIGAGMVTWSDRQHVWVLDLRNRRRFAWYQPDIGGAYGDFGHTRYGFFAVPYTGTKYGAPESYPIRVAWYDE